MLKSAMGQCILFWRQQRQQQQQKDVCTKQTQSEGTDEKDKRLSAEHQHGTARRSRRSEQVTPTIPNDHPATLSHSLQFSPPIHPCTLNLESALWLCRCRTSSFNRRAATNVHVAGRSGNNKQNFNEKRRQVTKTLWGPEVMEGSNNNLSSR